jgi:CheY-like chemotaxis protein
MAAPYILHVDDNEADLFLFRRAFQLARSDVELISLTSVYDAWVYLDTKGPGFPVELPRLLVLDLTLPHMNGMTFLETLRSDERYGGLSIVVMTGSDDIGDRNYCHRFRIESYIVKPANFTDLVKVAATLAGVTNRIHNGGVRPSPG